MLEAHGISQDAAEMLISSRKSRTHPFRGRFRQLCGVCPVPPRAAKRTPCLNRGGNRQPMLPVSVVIVECGITSRPSITSKKRKADAKANGNHPLSQAIRGREIFAIYAALKTVLRFESHLTDMEHQRPDGKLLWHDQNRTRAPRLLSNPEAARMTCSLIEGYYNVTATFALGYITPNSDVPLDVESAKRRR